MKHVHFFLLPLLCLFLQNGYAQSPTNLGNSPHQLGQGVVKPPPKDGRKRALIQKKRRENVIFTKETNFHGTIKALASGSHTRNSLGFTPKSIVVSNSGRYAVIALSGPCVKSFVVKDDIADLEQHIKDLVGVGGVLEGGAVVPPRPSSCYTISRITIMRY